MSSVQLRECPLSARQIEVLQAVANGFANKQIARLCGIKQQTVKNHISDILGTLHARDRTQAAVIAWTRGWIR